MIAANDNLSVGPVKFVRPTLHLSAAVGLLDRDEGEVIELIELGSIQWAWNVSGDNKRHREVRLLAASVCDFSQGRKVDRTFEQVLGLLFKHHRPTLRASEVRRALCCSSRHVLSLIRGGCFGAAARAGFRRQVGQRVSPSLPREAVVAWLEKRRLP